MSWLLSPVGAITSLNHVGDVTVVSVASGEVLMWNGSAWINRTLAEAGIAASGHNHTGVYEPVDTDIARHDTTGVTSAEWSIPSVARNKTEDYTMVLTDAGQTVRTTGSTAAQTLTIPANGSVAYPIGTLIGIENDSSVDWSLAITTDTMTWSKDNTTGTRTLAAGASAVLKKVTATGWKVAGSALVT